MVPPRDTSPDAFAVQIAQLRMAGPAARLAMAAEMSDAVHDLAAAGVRRRHPEYDAAQVAEVLIERLRERTARFPPPNASK
jgi:hypothetical protein